MKKITGVYIGLFINITILTVFLFLFFFDVPMMSCTSDRSLKVTSANAVDIYFLFYRQKLYEKGLNFVTPIRNEFLQKNALTLYETLVPVDYWWHPLFIYKSRAVETIITIQMREKNWKSVLAESEKLQTVDPRSPHPFYTAGIAYEQLGETDNAVRNYQEAITRDITHREAVRQLVKIYFKNGNSREAYKVLVEHFKVVDRIGDKKDEELVSIYNELHEKI